MKNESYDENPYFKNDKSKFMTLLDLVAGKRAAYFRSQLNKYHRDVLAWIGSCLPMLSDNVYTL